MEMIFHSRANMTRFYKKGCALDLILKVRVFGTRKWLIRNFYGFLTRAKKQKKKTNMLRQSPSCLTGFCEQSKTQRILFLV